MLALLEFPSRETAQAYIVAANLQFDSAQRSDIRAREIAYYDDLAADDAGWGDPHGALRASG